MGEFYLKMGDEDRQIKYINVGMEFTTKVARKILENLEGDEQEEQMSVMKNIMLDYIKMENEYNISKRVLGKLKKGLEAENADMNKDVEAEYRALKKKWRRVRQVGMTWRGMGGISG